MQYWTGNLANGYQPASRPFEFYKHYRTEAEENDKELIKKHDEDLNTDIRAS